MEPRPEDRKDAEIADGAGELGFFPPYSWWPLWCGRDAGVIVFGVALARWWLFIIGVGLGALALRLDLRVLPRRARALSRLTSRPAARHPGSRGARVTVPTARGASAFWAVRGPAVTLGGPDHCHSRRGAAHVRTSDPPWPRRGRRLRRRRPRLRPGAGRLPRCSGARPAARPADRGRRPAAVLVAAPATPAPVAVPTNVRGADATCPVDQPVQVDARNGRLEHGQVRPPARRQLAGTLSRRQDHLDRRRPLEPGTHYVVHAAAGGRRQAGHADDAASAPQDLTLDQQTYPRVAPLQARPSASACR